MLSGLVSRPSVSVVVPFAGSAADARTCVAALAELELGGTDELILVDNSGLGLTLEGPRVIRATRERSSYYARNAGAEGAAGEWILFLDSDCRPPPDLLARYLDRPVDPGCGILAGSVEGDPAQGSLAARYARSRGQLNVDYHLGAEPPAGITANLMVRRATWEGTGGFAEGIRSAGDIDFCWRAQELGWSLEPRPAAKVLHRHPDRLVRLRAKSRRYGAGQRWLGRRYAAAHGRPPIVKALVRSAGGAAWWAVTGRLERSRFKVIDAGIATAGLRGWLSGDNRALSFSEAPTPSPAPLAIATDAFPARSETFVFNEMRSLRGAGWRLRAESSARPVRPDLEVSREFEVAYAEDEPTAAALRDLALVLARHPVRALRDVLGRRRWRREEAVWPLRALAPAVRRLERCRGHIHVHFASLAALNAMRVADIAGASYSLEAHGYDIYRHPRNLPEKLERAAFATGTCDYTVEHLRGLVSDEASKRIHRVVMGVDPEAFTRSRPYPGGRRVVAIGRYVEKKGFIHLVRAAALLRDGGDPLDTMIIAGSGPLAEELEREVATRGLEGVVELREVWGAEAVRELLDQADLLAMPSVIAADGDRDSMPVVVKEALAMEVPVVGSDEVGIPEMIRPEWGRLAPPADPQGLAAAIADVLSLPAAERVEMGARGRAFVRRHCDVDTETEKLAALLHAAVPGLAPDSRA